MNISKIAVLTIVGAFVISSILIAIPGSEAEPAPFEITDSTGRTYTFNGPANNVVSFGPHTLTVVELGCKDKIVAIDKYSTKEYLKGDTRVDGLDSLSVGVVSSEGADNVFASLLQLVDDGKYNLETDVVLSIAWFSLIELRDRLVAEGFKVLCLKGDTYDEIVETIGKIGKVIGSKKTDQVVSSMLKTQTDIQEKIADNVLEADRVGFVLAWYSNDGLKIGNTGSVAVNFAETAGGINLGKNDEVSLSLYGAEISSILQANPNIVLTSNYVGTSEEFQDNELHTKSIRVLALNSTWNNYCPDAENGLKIIAKHLYPSLFEDYDIPLGTDVDYADEREDIEGLSYVAYIAVGIVATIAITVAAFCIRR